MQVSVESVKGLERRMTVELPPERVSQLVERRLQQIARSVRLDGFRPGKAPMRVVRQRYGDQARREAYGELIRTSFQEAATLENLRPASEPHIEIRDAEGERLGYVATFEVMPEVRLAEMSDVVVRRPVAQVQDADVDTMVDNLRRQRTRWVDVDRPAQKGDTLHISFRGTVDGESFDGGSADNVPLTLGSGSMIPGFEDGLVGASKGEARTVSVTFPENYRAEHLAGKAAQFEVTVNAVAEASVPEIDEDFIRSFGVEDGTLESLRYDVRANMERELAQKLETMTKERVMGMLLERNPVDIPAALIRDEAERLRRQAKDDMARAGHSSSLELPVSLFEQQAKRRVSLGLLVGEVIRTRGVQLDQARVRGKIERFAESYEDPAEVVQWYYGNRELLRSVENLVVEDQVVDILLGELKVEDDVTSFAAVMGASAQG
ncbi:MAG: trigger factor [Gammaproteobacteria bacterium]|nr:trigger factor [Gammaproteobacteria bacterium]